MHVGVNHAQHLYRWAIVTIELLPRPTALLHKTHKVDLEFLLLGMDGLRRKLDQELESPLVDAVERRLLNVVSREVGFRGTIDAPFQDVGIEGDGLYKSNSIRHDATLSIKR